MTGTSEQRDAAGHPRGIVMGSQKLSSGLDGAAALVTGAGRGLGAEIASALAQRGATVYALSRSASELDDVVTRIHNEGGQASAIVCDVTDVDAFSAAIDRMDRLDILVNNAGTNFPIEFVDVTLEQLDAMLLLNVRSMFTVAQACARKMIESGIARGSIINMSSQMGHVGAIRRSVYCMTKHAIEGLTKAMALELAANRICVNTVAPTFVETSMTKSFFADEKFYGWVMDRLPMRRLLPAEDVAAAVCYLASPAAAMVTGTSLRIDGGWTAQ
ncbi:MULTISPECIES: SDR family NAD(P)-dependent oxidoreductase [Paraburkholderia]|uniref:SDR family NAD(P)-dependent oxidoreductase n=1 Tax=Paraburkholderia TaxID=1822464 RepID=UPI002253A396|nr:MULTISPECIES: SDR family oxidoreductase [Paraburkholderia]MCX4163193.1 SDR family NAD(P)-dependent oxidoreductase [Paraburkholderia megapolitana]MDN7158689.1 SDR family oxidoreductase [Paraburkholderia sp. CHISQ3]MDQ6495736.1 SDR family oxidoreductase [Paraburkholderia megapolitana]